MVRRGTGVHEATWAASGRPERTDALAEEIVRWVRMAMGEMRRPHGINQVALALSCRDASGNVVRRTSFGVVQPDLFYRDEGGSRVAAFIREARGIAASEPREIGALLLSLGDLAYELDAIRAA